MMGACRRMGGWVGAIVVAIPACVVAMGCMWVLGLLSVMKVGLRLMWNPRIGGEEEEERKLRKEERRRRRAAGAGCSRSKEEDESAEMTTRLSLFHQYLDDQFNTLLVGDGLAHQLLHVCLSDSLLHPPPPHVDRPDSPVDQDCLQIRAD